MENFLDTQAKGGSVQVIDNTHFVVQKAFDPTSGQPTADIQKRVDRNELVADNAYMQARIDSNNAILAEMDKLPELIPKPPETIVVAGPNGEPVIQ